MSKTWDGFPAAAVTGIETLNMTNSGTTDLTFDMGGISGVNALAITATTGALDVTRANTGLKTLSISGLKGATTTTAKNFSLTLASDAAESATSSTADALAINLTDVGTAALYPSTLTVNNFETLNVNSTGTNFVGFSGATVNKMTVAGAGVTTITAVNSALANFDASASTGVVTADLSAVTATNTLKSAVLGAASDSLTLTRQGTQGNATLTGGAGTNTLNLSSNATGAAEYKQSGFQTVAIGASTGTLTLSGAATTDVSTYTFGSTTNDVTLVNQGAGNLTFSGTGVTAGNVTSDHTGTSTLNYSKTSTTTTSSTSGSAPSGDYTFSASTGALAVNVKTLVNGAATTVTSPYSSSVALTVDAGANVSGTVLSQWDSEISATRATSFTVTANGTLGNGALLSLPKATTGTITSAVPGEINLTTPLLTNLTVTAADTMNFVSVISGGAATSDLSGVQSLVAAANKGTTTFPNLAAASSLTLSGTGTSSKIVLANVGGDSAYDVALTATGLKASSTSASPQSGLTITDITAGTGYNITADVSGVTSGVSVTNVIGDTAAGTATTTAVAKDVTIKAAGLGGTLSLTAGVIGTGAVSVDAKGAGGLNMGTAPVRGGTVTIDGSGTSDVSVVTSDIGVKSAATITTHELAADRTYTIAANTGSTGLALTLKGGLNADSITVNGISGVAAYTLTGNLGAGTDAVVVNAQFSTAKSISLAGLTGYETSTLTGGSGIDTITGGAGVDTILGGAGADVMDGGAGADQYIINTADSSFSAPDSITMGTGDTITFGWATSTVFNKNTSTTSTPNTTAIAATDTSAAIDILGVATFNGVTSSTEMVDKVNAINKAVNVAGASVLFSHGGSVYMFADTDGAATANSTGVVIKLTGVSIPTLAASVASYDTSVTTASPATGLTGFAA
jgi:S-layer protein